MRRYCFIANYFLTPLQIAVAQGLRQCGIESVFIAVNPRWRDEILACGWPADQILYLPLQAGIDFTPFERFPIKFLDLVTADRALRLTPERGLAYLHRCAPAIHEFLLRHRVSYVFGEPTWAHERLTHTLCRHLGTAQFLSPHTVRYPANRWAFFPGEDQATLHELPRLQDVSRGTQEGSPKGVAVNATLTPPSYLQRNNELIAQAQTLRGRLDRVKRFLTRENIHPEDPTVVHSRWNTLRVAGQEEWNRLQYQRVRRTPLSDEVLNRPFVLFALHKQPESSIDVFGRYYEDQAELIHAIWRSLPTGWWLYVKEHTNAIGDRPRSFYEALQRKPQLAVLDERIPASRLIPASRAVFTVSGTVAYEAAMQGVPALTFAPMFFNRFPSCHRITPDDLRDADDLRQIIAKKKPGDTQSGSGPEDFVRNNSFEGRFTDAFTDPGVLEAGNVALLIGAFRRLAAA
jgi:hypothetical protein